MVRMGYDVSLLASEEMVQYVYANTLPKSKLRKLLVWLVAKLGEPDEELALVVEDTKEIREFAEDFEKLMQKWEFVWRNLHPSRSRVQMRGGTHTDMRVFERGGGGSGEDGGLLEEEPPRKRIRLVGFKPVKRVGEFKGKLDRNRRRNTRRAMKDSWSGTISQIYLDG